jgi:hypothetical protein
MQGQQRGIGSTTLSVERQMRSARSAPDCLANAPYAHWKYFVFGGTLWNLPRHDQLEIWVTFLEGIVSLLAAQYIKSRVARP